MVVRLPVTVIAAVVTSIGFRRLRVPSPRKVSDPTVRAVPAPLPLATTPPVLSPTVTTPTVPVPSSVPLVSVTGSVEATLLVCT